ncbi:hypothetical protein ONE56_06785 [Vibrio mytili]|uniref:hypothetical protein n=1 Tax=Vibrio mytili TaxID=50718 RepID=UPI003C6FF274
MNNDFEQDVNLGGSIERALSGDYKLKAGAVFNEAFRTTVQHFLSFSPAIIVLLVVQVGIFYIALQLQLGDPSVILDAFQNPDSFNNDIVSAIYIANFSYEVISAPIYAGICLMAMSHVAGLKTTLSHVGKGLQFTVPVIIATLFSLVLQGLVGMILAPLSLYLSLAFSHSILLICEKKVSPMQSLLLSLRAVNKKIFVVAILYLGVMFMFIAAAMFYGIGLIFVLPFLFHLKGILYREMFGIKVRVVTKKNDHDSDSNNDGGNSQVFDA